MRSSSKPWLFLSLLSIALLAFGHFLAGRQGVLFAVVIALSINCLIYFYGDWRWLPSLKAHELEGYDSWGLIPWVRDRARKLGIHTPQIFIIPYSTPQALSMGRSPRTAKIFLTEGLLEKLSPEEVQAVLLYQLCSIRRLDTFAFTVAGALADSLMSLASAVDWLIRWLIGNEKKLMTWLISPLASLVVHFAIGQRNYFLIDRMAGEQLKDVELMARVLWKLESYSRTAPLPIPESLAHQFIVNPLTTRGSGQYFQIQPNIRLRIERLVGHYPL